MRVSHCSLKPVLFAVFNNWRQKIGIVALSAVIVLVGFLFLMNYNKEIAQVESVFRIWWADTLWLTVGRRTGILHSFFSSRYSGKPCWRLQTGLSSPAHACGRPMRRAGGCWLTGIPDQDTSQCPSTFISVLSFLQVAACPCIWVSEMVFQRYRYNQDLKTEGKTFLHAEML